MITLSHFTILKLKYELKYIFPKKVKIFIFVYEAIYQAYLYGKDKNISESILLYKFIFL